MGLLVSAITGVCTAFAVGQIVPGMTFRESLVILGATVAKDILLFLKEHPVEKISDGQGEGCSCKLPS
jgi:hypothetical protein